MTDTEKLKTLTEAGLNATIKLSYFWAGVILNTLAIWGYWELFGADTNLFLFAINCLVASCGIGGFYYAHQSLKLNRAVAAHNKSAHLEIVNLEKERLELERKLAQTEHKKIALELSRYWTTDEMRKKRDSLKAIWTEYKEKKPAEFIELCDKHADELRYVFGYFEEIAVAIENGVADERLLYQNLRSPYVGNFQICKKWIENRRETKGQPQMYEHVFALAEKWSVKMKENGDPIPTPNTKGKDAPKNGLPADS